MSLHNDITVFVVTRPGIMIPYKFIDDLDYRIMAHEMTCEQDYMYKLSEFDILIYNVTPQEGK